MTLRRLVFRLRLLCHGIPWSKSKYLDNRPLTEADIKRGREIAKQFGLLNEEGIDLLKSVKDAKAGSTKNVSEVRQSVNKKPRVDN